MFDDRFDLSAGDGQPLRPSRLERPPITVERGRHGLQAAQDGFPPLPGAGVVGAEDHSQILVGADDVVQVAEVLLGVGQGRNHLALVEQHVLSQSVAVVSDVAGSSPPLDVGPDTGPLFIAFGRQVGPAVIVTGHPGHGGIDGIGGSGQVGGLVTQREDVGHLASLWARDAGRKCFRNAKPHQIGPEATAAGGTLRV